MSMKFWVFSDKHSYQGPLFKLQFTSRYCPFHLWQLQAVKHTTHTYVVLYMLYLKGVSGTLYLPFWFVSRSWSRDVGIFKMAFMFFFVFLQCELISAPDYFKYMIFFMPLICTYQLSKQTGHYLLCQGSQMFEKVRCKCLIRYSLVCTNTMQLVFSYSVWHPRAVI